MKLGSIILIGFVITISGSALIQEREGPDLDQKTSSALSENGIEISVSVQSTNENGTMASSENKAALDKIVDALIAMGINKSDISPGQFTGVSTGQSSNVVCNKIGNDTICSTESSHKNVITSTKIVRIRSKDPDFVNRVLDTVETLGANASVINQ